MKKMPEILGRTASLVFLEFAVGAGGVFLSPLVSFFPEAEAGVAGGWGLEVLMAFLCVRVFWMPGAGPWKIEGMGEVNFCCLQGAGLSATPPALCPPARCRAPCREDRGPNLGNNVEIEL